MSVPDLAAAGVSTSKFPLLRLFSMTPPPQQQSSPTMRPSEKLLRDALLRDERERQQQLSGDNPPVTPPTHRRRHSYVPISSHSASASAGGSFLLHTTMSNPRSRSRSSVSQGSELERDGGNSPVNRILFHGGEVERQSHQQQQSTTPHRHHVRRSSPSPSPSPSRRSSTSTSPSPSPLHMKRRRENLGRPNAHTNTPPIPRSLGLQNTTPNRYGSVYPSQRLGEPTQMTPHEQALRASLERVLTTSGESNSRMRDGGDENEVRDEQGGWPWRRARKSTGGCSGSGSILSFNTVLTNSSSASNSTSNSSPSHTQSQLYYPRTPQTQTRTYHPTTSTPNRTTRIPTGNNQRGPYYSPSSPHTPFSAPGGGVPTTGYSHSPSHTRTRSQTDPNPPSYPNTNPNPSSQSTTPPTLNLGSNSKSTKESGAMIPPLPLLLWNDVGTGVAEEELRLLTPPPTPPFMARVPAGGGYAPSPYKTTTANPSPNGSSTPTRIPVRTQTQNTQKKKEAGLETRRPTQGPAAGYKEKGKEQAPLRPLDFPLAASRPRGGQRQRDVTVTQQSQARLATTTNPDPKKVVNNTDGHSLASTESCSARTSGSSASHSHSYVERASAPAFGACSSHSSLDGPLGSPQPSFVGDDVYAYSPHLIHKHHHLHRNQSNPPSPSSPTSTTHNPFNARKASTQCRAIEGYVSFASVEGLGEPPLMGDEFDGGEGDGGKGKCGRGRVGAAFLPLGVWTAALGWKRFLGGAGAGAGVEGQEQGVVV